MRLTSRFILKHLTCINFLFLLPLSRINIEIISLCLTFFLEVSKIVSRHQRIVLRYQRRQKIYKKIFIAFLKNIHIILFFNFLEFSFISLINHNVNLKSKQTCVALNNFSKVIHFEGYQIVERETSYCRSVIHATSCISSCSILDSFCHRYVLIELSSQDSLPLCRSLCHAAFLFCISVRKKQKKKRRQN